MKNNLFNLFNRIFHNKTVKDNKCLADLYEKRIQQFQRYHITLENCKDLEELLQIHKNLFPYFRCPNLDVCSYGMFRASSISLMNSHQVFLGGIYGLNTMALAYWQAHKDEEYGINGFGIPEDTKIYHLVFRQYYNVVFNNITTMYHEALWKLQELQRLGY